jgi:hypothetical protein
MSDTAGIPPVLARDLAAVAEAGGLSYDPAAALPAPDAAVLEYARKALRAMPSGELTAYAYGMVRYYASVSDPTVALASVRAVLQAESEVQAEKDSESRR